MLGYYFKESKNTYKIDVIRVIWSLHSRGNLHQCPKIVGFMNQKLTNYATIKLICLCLSDRTSLVTSLKHHQRQRGT